MSTGDFLRYFLLGMLLTVLEELEAKKSIALLCDQATHPLLTLTGAHALAHCTILEMESSIKSISTINPTITKNTECLIVNENE